MHADRTDDAAAERRIRADQTQQIVEWLNRYADEYQNPQAVWFASAIAQEFSPDPHD